MRKRIIAIATVLFMALSLLAITPDTASAASAKYWLKVNTQANVINVYKKTDGKWKPYKVMLCSCGKSGKPRKAENRNALMAHVAEEDKLPP